MWKQKRTAKEDTIDINERNNGRTAAHIKDITTIVWVNFKMHNPDTTEIKNDLHFFLSLSTTSLNAFHSIQRLQNGTIIRLFAHLKVYSAIYMMAKRWK